jgi:hypothetical protein
MDLSICSIRKFRNATRAKSMRSIPAFFTKSNFPHAPQAV